MLSMISLLDKAKAFLPSGIQQQLGITKQDLNLLPQVQTAYDEMVKYANTTLGHAAKYLDPEQYKRTDITVEWVLAGDTVKAAYPCPESQSDTQKDQNKIRMFIRENYSSDAFWNYIVDEDDEKDEANEQASAEDKTPSSDKLSAKEEASESEDIVSEEDVAETEEDIVELEANNFAAATLYAICSIARIYKDTKQFQDDLKNKEFSKLTKLEADITDFVNELKIILPVVDKHFSSEGKTIDSKKIRENLIKVTEQLKAHLPAESKNVEEVKEVESKKKITPVAR